MIELLSKQYEQTLEIAQILTAGLKSGDIVCLYGDLGAGKTAFVKGMVEGLKNDALNVHSPTFTLMNIYQGKLPLYHFDLYRIKAEDLFDLGYEEFFYGKGVCAIEWSERLDYLEPKECWKVYLSHQGDDQRLIQIRYQGEGLQEAFQRLSTILSDHHCIHVSSKAKG